MYFLLCGGCILILSHTAIRLKSRSLSRPDCTCILVTMAIVATGAAVLNVVENAGDEFGADIHWVQLPAFC